jgi:hypothetical protein
MKLGAQLLRAQLQRQPQLFATCLQANADLLLHLHTEGAHHRLRLLNRQIVHTISYAAATRRPMWAASAELQLPRLAPRCCRRCWRRCCCVERLHLERWPVPARCYWLVWVLGTQDLLLPL